MNMMVILLAVMGMTIAGLALLYYDSYLVTSSFNITSDLIRPDRSLEIIEELDPEINSNGIYFVQRIGSNEGDISVRIFDPYGSQIISRDMEEESHEEQFEIVTSGEYRMIIENSGKDTEVQALLGYTPDSDMNIIGRVGIYILLAGMIGMAAIAVNLIIVRRRRREKI